MNDEEEEEMRKLYQLYKAERDMGLLRPQEEIDQDIRDAGRGHLLGDRE